MRLHDKWRWRIAVGALALALSGAGCSDGSDDSGGSDSTGGEATSEDVSDAAPSGEGGETATEEGGEGGSKEGGEGGTGEDGGETSTGEEGGATEVGELGPLANVYMNNPLDSATTEVELPHLTGEDGILLGQYADVWNCIQEEGEALNFQGITAYVCKQTRTALPGSDGTYRHIDPGSDTDGNDAFAELMMYFHMNRIHDYFKGTHGLSALDQPLFALTNVQIKIDVFGGWQPFDNAAFVPKESAQYFPFPIEGDSIIFGQGTNVDFSYESDVIYHEYTHAMIGTTRLTGVRLDEYGPDLSPGAMNEGFADYFAASITEDPVIGSYALSNVSSMFSQGPPQDVSRDLSHFKRCPEDLLTEVHADGEIIGSAVWSLREELGAEVTDSIVLKALQTFTNEVGFNEAALAIVAEAAKLDPPQDEVVTAILTDHGLIGCDRVFDYETYFQATDLPLSFAGTQETGLMEFSNYVPSYTQWRYTLEPGKSVAKVTFSVATQGGFFGGGQPPELRLAVKAGGEPIRYTYGAFATSHDADSVTETVQSTGQQGMTKYDAYLFGDCIEAGATLTFQIHNKSATGGQIYTMQILSLDAPPEGADETVFGCGG